VGNVTQAKEKLFAFSADFLLVVERIIMECDKAVESNVECVCECVGNRSVVALHSSPSFF